MKKAHEVYRQARRMSDHDGAIRLAEESLQLAEEEADSHIAVLSLLELGMRSVFLADMTRGRQVLARALPMLELMGMESERGACLYFLSCALDEVESPDSHMDILRRALPLLENGGDHILAGDCCSAMAKLTSDPRDADHMYERAADHYRQTESVLRLPYVQRLRADLALQRGDQERAAIFLQDGLRQIREVRRNRLARKSEAEILEALGDCDMKRGRKESAMRNYRDSLRLLQWLDLSSAAQRVGAKLGCDR
jgi:tetratricopeptide (TPR) repeat protein